MRKSDKTHEERMKWLDKQHEEKIKKMDEEIAETKKQTKLIDEQKAKIKKKQNFDVQFIWMTEEEVRINFLTQQIKPTKNNSFWNNKIVK